MIAPFLFLRVRSELVRRADIQCPVTMHGGHLQGFHASLALMP